MSENPAAVGPFCYFVPLLRTLRNRSVLRSMKKYEYHTFYVDKYVLIWTTRLHDALIWLAALAIQDMIRDRLLFANFVFLLLWWIFGTTTTSLLKFYWSLLQMRKRPKNNRCHVKLDHQAAAVLAKETHLMWTDDEFFIRTFFSTITGDNCQYTRPVTSGDSLNFLSGSSTRLWRR